jgi:hypothetical protein
METLEQHVTLELSYSSQSMSRSAMLSDLHRIACVLYINRAVHVVSGTEYRHRRLVKDGVILLSKMSTCQNAWPLLIIACEADEDEQRQTVLEVFDRSLQETRDRTSHIPVVQHIAQAMWNQQDLKMDNQVDYLTVFDAVVQGIPFMPSFA